MLDKAFNQGYAGYVHFQTIDKEKKPDIKVMILLYNSDKQTYLGFIPNEQNNFVNDIRKVIQQQKEHQQKSQQQQL